MSTDTTTPSAGSPQRITLPDSLIRAITLAAADPSGRPVAALEAAVLITFGYALYRRQDRIDPRQVTIPTAQWHAIATALTTTPTTGDIGRVNLGLDWVNYGPANHEGDLAPVGDPPVEDWSEVAAHPVAAWRADVAAGATRLGYGAWVTATRTLAAGGRAS